MKTKILISLLVLIAALLGTVVLYLRPTQDHSSPETIVTPHEDWSVTPVPAHSAPSQPKK